MRIVHAFQELARTAPRIALAAGFFDGVHRGHQQVLEATVAQARRIGGEAWALTFAPHPMAVLAPARRPALLTSTALRLERLAAAGLDGCILMRFTRALARMTPTAFVRNVLCVGDWHPQTVLAGANWRFGAGGQGGVATLPELSDGRIGALVVAPLLDEGEVVSSTRIRQAIVAGDLSTATRLLGRPYRLRARVERGRGIGRRLGYATANLTPHAEVLPPFGIYALWAGIAGQVHPAVGDFGLCPTFPREGPPRPPIEVHLLDFDGDLYDRELDVGFVARLRDERHFPDAAALVAAIRADVDQARVILTVPPVGLFGAPCNVPQWAIAP